MQLLAPMAVVVFLTFIVMTAMVISRVYAVKKRQVKAGYFKVYVNESKLDIPAYIIQIGRNYNNLLELPPLFYVTCLIFMFTGQIDSITVNLAWVFAIGRVLHSIIHITINHVIARLLIFAVSCVGLLGMWIQLVGKNFL